MTEQITYRIYDKYGNRPLTAAICYQLSDPGSVEDNIKNIINYIQTMLNTKFNINLDITYLSILLI